MERYRRQSPPRAYRLREGVRFHEGPCTFDPGPRGSVSGFRYGRPPLLPPPRRNEGEHLSRKLRADEKSEVHFNQDVRPILSNRCFKCHGTDLQKGGLDLQGFATATKKLDGGEAAVVPGDNAKSELMRRVTADPEERMPPKGDPLTPEQIAVLKAWIDRGAKYEEHWAYVKPVQKPFPEVMDKNWPRNGIDAWVLARLEQEGLTPSPEADKPTLLRRVTLDLTGLPPTPAELDAFLADPSPDAYEKAVDRLLASPAYGEHHARYWLDLARYADTNGYEKDDRRTAWPYRDWVINTFNKNMPFDEFTIEQIAGDLLPNATLDQKIATGFHRNTMVNTEGGTDDQDFRVAAIEDPADYDEQELPDAARPAPVPSVITTNSIHLSRRSSTSSSPSSTARRTTAGAMSRNCRWRRRNRRPASKRCRTAPPY